MDSSEPEACGHCGRPIPSASRGIAADGTVLCHTGTMPPDTDPPDCYRLVTVYQHATDGSCCREGKPPPWKSLRDVPDDFAACSYSSGCWRTGAHTYKPRECSYAERAAPEFGFWRTFTAEDGCDSIAMASIPFAAVLPWASRLSVDQQHQMLEEAADSDDPARVIVQWKRRAYGSAPDGAVTITMGPPAFGAPDPGIGPGALRQAYEMGRLQGRYETGR